MLRITFIQLASRSQRLLSLLQELDEIEFGVPQTLKALYGWQGQLNKTNAVSLIKGKYNVVLNKPITADAYSFVYND